MLLKRLNGHIQKNNNLEAEAKNDQATIKRVFDI